VIGKAAADYVFPGRPLVPKTVPYNIRDSIRNYQAFPESHEELQALLPSGAIKTNRKAFFTLMGSFPEFKVVTITRQLHYRPERGGRAWDQRDFEEIARKVERCTSTWERRRGKTEHELLQNMPDHWHPITTVPLHELAMSILVLQAGIIGEYDFCVDVFLGGDENSLLAVHALAVTLYGAFRKHAGNSLGREEQIHCGPVNLFYDTEGKDAAIGKVGLVGVRRQPHKLIRRDETVAMTQLERASKSLPSSFVKMVCDEMFVHEKLYEKYVDAGEACAELNAAWTGHAQPEKPGKVRAESLYPEDEEDGQEICHTLVSAGAQDRHPESSSDESVENEDRLLLHDI